MGLSEGLEDEFAGIGYCCDFGWRRVSLSWSCQITLKSCYDSPTPWQLQWQPWRFRIPQSYLLRFWRNSYSQPSRWHDQISRTKVGGWKTWRGKNILYIYIYANQIGSGNPRVQGLKNFCNPTSRHPFLAHLKSHAVLARSQIYTIPSHMFPRITFAKRKLCKVHFRDSQSTSPKIQHRMSQHLDPPTYFFGNGDPFRWK